jgi:hypothetical protein
VLWRYSLIIGNRRCTSGSDLYTGEGVVSDAREYDETCSSVTEGAAARYSCASPPTRFRPY